MAHTYQKLSSIYRIDFIDTNRKDGVNYTFSSKTIENAKLLASLTGTNLDVTNPPTEVSLPSLNLGTGENEEKNVYLIIQPLLRFGNSTYEYAHYMLDTKLRLHVNSTARLKLPSDTMSIKTGNSTSQTTVVPVVQHTVIGKPDVIDYQGLANVTSTTTHFSVTFEIQLTGTGENDVSKEYFEVSKNNLQIQYTKFETTEIGGWGESPTTGWNNVPVSSLTISDNPGEGGHTKFLVNIANLIFDTADYDTEYAFRWRNKSDPTGKFSKVTTIRILHQAIVEDYVEFVTPDDFAAYVGKPIVTVKLGKVGTEVPDIEQ